MSFLVSPLGGFQDSHTSDWLLSHLSGFLYEMVPGKKEQSFPLCPLSPLAVAAACPPSSASSLSNVQRTLQSWCPSELDHCGVRFPARLCSTCAQSDARESG